ncbi:MAG: ABC transporter permease, partial [Firmicutes bacterium]|nr:ABC transporter permease [Bacillota bacterium]
LIAGLVTGILHTFMGIPAILAGILTQLMLWSANLKIMGAANIALPVRKYQLLLAQIYTSKSLILLLGFVVVLIALLYWFFGTELGASIRATGNNIKMSRAQGINTDITTIMGLALSNGIVAMSGALLAQYQGFADINMGRGAIVIGLAAVIIGEIVVSHISTKMAVRLLGVIIGGIVYYFVYQTVIFLGLDADLLKMLSAIVVAVFLAVPYWKQKYFRSYKGVKKHA